MVIKIKIIFLILVFCSYKLYKETERLMKYEYSFAKTVGIPVVQESKYNILYGNKQLSLLEKNQEINLTELNKNLENPSKK